MCGEISPSRKTNIIVHGLDIQKIEVEYRDKYSALVSHITNTERLNTVITVLPKGCMRFHYAVGEVNEE